MDENFYSWTVRYIHFSDLHVCRLFKAHNVLLLTGLRPSRLSKSTHETQQVILSMVALKDVMCSDTVIGLFIREALKAETA